MFAMLLIVPVSGATASGPPSFGLPDQASEVAQGVFFLGYAVEDGVDLVGYAYARYAAAGEDGRSAKAKPNDRGNGGGKPGGGGGGGEESPSQCYSYIARGAHWLSAETYHFNSNSPSGNLDGVSIADANGAFGSWETAAENSSIITEPNSTTTDKLTADTTGTDGKNEIYFAHISDANVLGYTIVWSTRTRGRNIGQIVEADMVIDDDDWDWYTGTSAVGSGQIDFLSVFTHEAGHWVGMGHTKTETWCEQQTMYPSITRTDDSKRELGVGDTAGVHGLYS